MRILIATAQVPFMRGGAEIQAEGLRDALKASGHEAEIIGIPFKWYPPEKILDHILACRLLDLTEVSGMPVDMLIGLKFPAYLIPHPNKILWILHQHRMAYELWSHPLSDMIHYPNGGRVRDAIQHADRQRIPEARAVYANSRNVAERLKKYCDIDAVPLYHPPLHAQEFYSAEAEDYFFFPSRLGILKRQSLVIEALVLTRHSVRVRFAGVPDHPSYALELDALARKLKVEKNIEWLGNITEPEKLRLYAHALGVVYPPLDEDYGYVTLEAMLAAKPVVTCTDSGGPLEFVLDKETGLVSKPTPEALAAALDDIWERRAEAREWGKSGRARYDSMGLSWTRVVEKLLS